MAGGVRGGGGDPAAYSIPKTKDGQKMGSFISPILAQFDPISWSTPKFGDEAI